MDFGAELHKYQWPIIIGGGVLVGFYLYYKNSTSGTSSTSTPSSSGYNASVAAAQAAATQSNDQLAAVQYSTEAQAQAYQAQSAAQQAEYADASQSQVATDALAAYTSVQNAALIASEKNNRTSAELASNLYANTLQAKATQQALNDQLAAYTVNQVVGTLQNQNITQAYTAMSQAQSLAKQNISGNNALSAANQAGTSASGKYGIGGILGHASFSGGGYKVGL